MLIDHLGDGWIVDVAPCYCGWDGIDHYGCACLLLPDEGWGICLHGDCKEKAWHGSIHQLCEAHYIEWCRAWVGVPTNEYEIP